MSPQKSWQTIVAEKQSRRAAAIDSVLPTLPKECTVAVSGHDDVAGLAMRMSKGEITAETVTQAYIARAIEAQKHTNCLSEPLFESALSQARALDRHYAETGRLKGPLHGIPMSVKDQFNVKGFDTTLGYVGRSFNPAERDAVLVSLLKSLGAVVVSKTTIPQSILWGETESPLWGVTTHPENPCLTPGGSSGGEAALVAMNGSLCGWGTDIGGSIRGRSHFCGLFGLKPTSTRFPYAGVPVSHDGQTHVPSSVGPISRRLSTLVSVTRECLRSEPWISDPNVAPLPWRQHIYDEMQSRPLKVGLILDDGVVRPHPEVEDAMRRIASLLESAGHVLVPWDTSSHLECIALMDQLYRVDGGEDIRSEISLAGEPALPHVAALLESAAPASVYEYWQLNRRKVALQQAYNDKWNVSPGLLSSDTEFKQVVDVLISPVLPHAAVPHRMVGKWTGYTKIWNFLDYTAMAVPVGEATAELSKTEEYRSHSPRNAHDEWNHRIYDPQASNGLPIGIQVIGRRFEEEKVLGVAEVLQMLMRGTLAR